MERKIDMYTDTDTHGQADGNKEVKIKGRSKK
jgi:hypothetical protein